MTPGGGGIAPINAIMDRFASRKPKKNNKYQVVNLLSNEKVDAIIFQKTIDSIVINVIVE